MTVFGLFRRTQHNRLTGAMALALIALIWLGMVVGISFLATTAKFLAPTLALTTALDVGRHTFAVFSRVEIVFYVAMLLVIAGFALNRLTWVMAIALGAIVVSDQVWLLSALDHRVGIILAGGTPTSSQLHTLFITLEGIKAALLCFLGIGAVFALAADVPE